MSESAESGVLRTCFVFQSAGDTTGYYSRVLNRLDAVPEIEVTIVFGGGKKCLDGRYTGSGCKEIGSREECWADGELWLPELADLLMSLRPDVVITVPEYLESFRRDHTLRTVWRRNGFKLLLKSIPFRVPLLSEYRADAMRRVRERLAQPSRWQSPFLRFGVGGRWVTKAMDLARAGIGGFRVERDCARQCRRWQLPDGHVNYIEDAFAVYGSYGVPAERIHIIGNSPDTDWHFAQRDRVEREGVKRRPYRLLHVGRLVEWKRVDLLLHAAHRLRPRHPELDVVIAGEGPMAGEWKRLSVELEQEEYVRFVGGVYDPSALARLFMESGVYVLAGMGGISINDAMCYGCPVVCSVCDGTEKKLVRHGVTGLVFQDGDCDDLTAKLGSLLSDPGEQRRLAQGGLGMVLNEVNIHAVLRGYVRAFQSTTGRSLKTSLQHIDDGERRSRQAHVGLLT